MDKEIDNNDMNQIIMPLCLANKKERKAQASIAIVQYSILNSNAIVSCYIIGENVKSCPEILKSFVV